MEKASRPEIDIEQLRKDIYQEELNVQNYLNESNNMKYLIFISVICMIFFLFMSKFITASIFFVIGFMCLRKYNRAIGMAEIHNGVRKFLQMILIQEQTGEDVFKKILS